MRTSSVSALAMAAMLLMMACSDTQVVTSNAGSPGGGEDPPAENNDPQEQNHHDGHYVDDDGHGPDPDAEWEEASEVTGSWRVARLENDAPVAYFDLFGTLDEPDHTGYFVMGLEPAEMLDGHRGDILTATWESEQLVVEWNPTAQQSESYRVTTTERIDEDRLRGLFQATQAPFEFEVSVERMQFDD